MSEATVTVIARRPYVRGAVTYQPGDPVLGVPVLEAIRLERKGIVSTSKRPGARRAARPDPGRPLRKIRKSAA